MKPAVLICMVRGIDHMAEALLDRADLELITLHDLTAEVLAKKGIAHRCFNEFLTDELRHCATYQAAHRAHAVSKELCSPAMRREWPDLHGQTWNDVRRALAEVLQRDFIEEILAIDMLRKIASETDLRLVLVPEDICRDTKTIVSAARCLGVPSLHVLHGFPCATSYAHDTVTSDVITAYSERLKQIYVGFGAAPERVYVTGNPAWDRYARPAWPGFKERVCHELGLDPARPIIEYALTNSTRFSAISVERALYHIESTQAVLRAFTALSRRHPDWQFLLRPHPSDRNSVEPLMEAARAQGLADVRLDGQLAYDSIVTVDALLCTHSNMGIEAILYGKPVVNVAIDTIVGRVFEEGMGPLFLEEDAVLWARREDEIAPLVESAVLDRATRAELLERRALSIERFNRANDGLATARVCALALDMIERPEAFVQPLARYPEFEPALAQATPADARSIFVVGRAARCTADAIATAHPNAEIRTARTLDEIGRGGPAPDAIVLADPIDPDEAAEGLLTRAIESVGTQGNVVACFRNARSHDAVGAFLADAWVPARTQAEAAYPLDAFSWPGVEILLSRCELEACERRDVAWAPAVAPESDGQDAPAFEPIGWAVCARRRKTVASAYARSRGERRERAAVANRRGEALYNAGDAAGAVHAFAEAANTWNDEPVYFSNLAAALFALGHAEEAWRRILDAIYLDPFSDGVRANFRMIANGLDRDEEAEGLLALFGAD